MSRLTFVLFAVMLTLYVTVNADDRCPPNQSWTECGSYCPPTCTNPNPEICPAQCVIGCQCNSGLLRNDAGECIPESQCES
ncbi:chymotrypsin inhibitor-like [Lasioglossum baleicum]|uniref:chymotrypsin inhibitor-like n=1 Tax=Lasioglossum baleicum TaxID=434251 RepID=UPI003FCC53AC